MQTYTPFSPFPKIPRLQRDCWITEKIDGTNAQLSIVLTDELAEMPTNETPLGTTGPYTVFAGSRNKIITPSNDNHGFAKWAFDKLDELAFGLGSGRHYGEWWGSGIQRGYRLREKRFSLFNTGRWNEASDAHICVATKWCAESKAEVEVWTKPAPACCHVVPVIYKGLFCTERVQEAIEDLRAYGSSAARGYMNPEGVVVYHVAANAYFKQTLQHDAEPKGKVKG